MKRRNKSSTSVQLTVPQGLETVKPNTSISRLRAKAKPTQGYAHVVHLLLSAVFPLVLYILVRIDLAQVAIVVVLLSKWRMIAVRPRFWLAIFRANAVDLLVSIGTVLFMHQTTAAWLQLFWAGLLVVWQIWVKPRKGALGIACQAMIGQAYGLVGLYTAWPDAPLYMLVLATGLIAYLSARHYLTGFDEPHAPLYANTWAFFAASLAWISAHWLLYYGVIAQVVLFLMVLSFSLGGLYYLQEHDKLTSYLKRQIVLIMIAIVTVILLFSEWGSKVV